MIQKLEDPFHAVCLARKAKALPWDARYDSEVARLIARFQHQGKDYHLAASPPSTFTVLFTLVQIYHQEEQLRWAKAD